MSGGRVDLKVVLLGKEYSGKTSLVERYLYKRFLGSIPYQNTIGAAFGAKKIHIEDKDWVLGLWDTAGSERYEAMSRIYYRGAWAAILCYDLTDRTSFDRARFWIDELRRTEEKCRIYMCGTKKDLVTPGDSSRKVEKATITSLADDVRADIFETSSKTGENIDEMFLKIVTDFHAEHKSHSREVVVALFSCNQRHPALNCGESGVVCKTNYSRFREM